MPLASPSRHLFDFDHVDLDDPKADLEFIHRVNPHRGAMVQLTSVAWWDERRGVGVRDIKPDEFWCDGHIPGRPLFPGVLMIEAAAQLSSFVQLVPDVDVPDRPFLGFVRCDKAAFRGQVVPGDRLVILMELIKRNKRRFVSQCQGFVDSQLVFEVNVTGMSL